MNALVDSDIKGLVEALSGFRELQTIESCQDIGNGSAWVSFQYGSSSEDLGLFIISRLGPKIIEAVGDGADISVRIGTSLKAVAELTIRNGAMGEAIGAIQEATLDFRNGH